MKHSNRFASVAALLAAVAAGLASAQPVFAQTPAPAPAQAGGKIVVKKADDLPRHRYTVKGKALEIIKDDAQLKALARQIAADITADLEKYQIDDKSTLRGMYEVLQMSAVVLGDYDAALGYNAKAKELDTKESEKLMRGVGLRAYAAALKESGGDEAKLIAAFKKNLHENVSKLPYPVIKDTLINVRGQAKMVTRQLVEASFSSQADAVIKANNGELSQDVAAGFLQIKFVLDVGLKILPAQAEVYGQIIDAQTKVGAEEKDLWTPRLIALEATAPAKPVAVAVWDSGVDTSLFDGQLLVDDNTNIPRGLSFDQKHKRMKGPLVSLEGLKSDKAMLMGFIAASMDMQAGIDNEGVKKFQEHMRSLKGDEVRDFMDDMGAIGNYVHGTHVAGITAAGNPFIRLVHITESWPTKSIPDTAPTVEEFIRWGESSQEAVDYLKANGVRVVNMSWRISRPAVEAWLEAKGVGKDQKERAELSRKIYLEFSTRLEKAIASAPEILFIAAAGNEDNDLDFSEYVPAGIRLPNLITVGAVDHRDKQTSFTSVGKDVVLYSNGYRVESVVPGGAKVKFSGTSMAAPNVSNLAAKILALKPGLKPREVVELMRKSADPLPELPGRFVINPKKTIEALGAK